MQTLETLKPRLDAIPAEAVRAPRVPMANALQEAQDLLHLCRTQRVGSAIVAAGVEPTFATDLEQRIEVARLAQSRWANARDVTKSTSLVEQEQKAAETRSDMIAAARWNLRNDREAHATLSAIRGGDSVADLVQDLFDLATLYENHAEAFEGDQLVDATARAADARKLASALSSGVSDDRLDPEPLGTRDLRDRAFTYLDDLVTELRSAGRYVFRREPDIAKRFASRYRRRTRRGTKSEEVQTDVVEEEVTGDVVAV